MFFKAIKAPVLSFQKALGPDESSCKTFLLVNEWIQNNEKNPDLTVLDTFFPQMIFDVSFIKQTVEPNLLRQAWTLTDRTSTCSFQPNWCTCEETTQSRFTGFTRWTENWLHRTTTRASGADVLLFVSASVGKRRQKIFRCATWHRNRRVTKLSTFEHSSSHKSLKLRKTTCFPWHSNVLKLRDGRKSHLQSFCFLPLWTQPPQARFHTFFFSPSR